MRATLLGLVAAFAPWFATAQERLADIRQGTNLALTVAPGGHTLVVDLIGQLWSLPATGGGAVPLTPAGEAARNPRFSPDGTHVVYQRLVDGQWDLWLLEIATSERRPLASSPFNEREPDFAADGRSVVFTSDRTGHDCLWSVTVDGGIETQLTEEPGDASYPAMAPQGQVAYAHEGANGWSIRVLGRDGASAVVHASARPLTAPSWRPGGGVIVFGEQDSTGTSRLWLLIRSEPQVLKPLSGGEDLFPTRAAWLSGAEFVYAADGQIWRRGIAHPVRYPLHLFAATSVAAAAPPLPLPLFDHAGERVAAGMSPASHSADGRQTAFSALGDLWLTERGRSERLTDDAFADLDPALLPDGSGVIFSSDRNGQFELWHLALPERRLTAITSGAVLPRQPSIRPDGRQIAYLESESFEPWVTARLRVRDWPSGFDVTVATKLEGASQPTWAADGRSLNVQALAGETSRETPRGLGVTLLRPLSAPANGSATGVSPPATVTWRAPPPPADYVVEIGRLFDGVSGTYRRHVDLHVRAGRIAAIVARGLLAASGTVIDARDRTVIPGLIDVHAHQPALAGERLGRAWLAHGVTTVREIADRPAEALERAESWASGRALGPRLVITPNTADPLPGEDPMLPIRPFAGLTNGFAHSLTRQARELALPARLNPPARLRVAAAPAGPFELEVSPTLTTYQDGVSRLVASGATYTPGLAAISGMGGWPSTSQSGRRRSEAYRALFNLAEQSAWERQAPLAEGTLALGLTVARLVRAGGLVAIGSEAPAVPYGLGVHLEMAALARAGIAPDQILRMATMGGALALGLEQQVGSLEEGKLADFVVLDGDPLVDLGATLDIVAVAKGGVWRERAALLASP